MELKVKSYSSQSSLISSIIFVIIGAILFSNADRVIEIISIAIGLILATTGIISLVIYYFKLKKNNHSETGSLTLGIITIILAIIFIFFSSLVEQFIRFIIGGWILFSGIIRLINALSSGKRNTTFIPLLIVSALLILVGIYTIVVGDVILSTIGLIMMIYAVIEIIGFIFYSKDKEEKETEGTTSLIISKNENQKTEKKNNKKIKDVEEDVEETEK